MQTGSNQKPIGVVLMQFGGPDSLEAVEPFLYNLFSDPDIFQLPLGKLGQRTFAKYLSRSRTRIVREEYEEMGGKSPIVEKTRDQVIAVQNYLDMKLGNGYCKVDLAMRYWKPFTRAVVERMVSEGLSDLILLPLYAQYSSVNAGSSFNEWDRVKREMGVDFTERRVREFRQHPKYIAALSARIDEALTRFPDPGKVFFLFSAHGIPVDLVFAGDPYPQHIRDTMDALMHSRNNDHFFTLAYQSKVGPKQWLTPSTSDSIEELGRLGITDMLVIPIAFVSDHIETVQELDVEERENAEKAGIERFEVTEGLNTHPFFIEALGEIVVEEIRQLRPGGII